MSTFFCDSGNCKVVSIPEYLRSFPGRGSAFGERRLGLQFHQLHDCLCCGLSQQVLAPVHGRVLPVLLRESGTYPAHDAALPSWAAQALARGSQAVEIPQAVPLYPAGADNLWHWTLESLPKLLLLEEMGYTGPYIVKHDCALVEQSLDMFGIARERRLPAGPLYRVERMIVPPRLSAYDDLPENMGLTAFLRQKILERVGVLPGSKRCYVRRIGRRRVANEEHLLTVLDEFGFEVMVPEELDLAAQWRHMTNAECSVMAHGANTTLTLVQPQGSALVEFFSNRYVNYSNMHAVRLLRLRYLPLVEELDCSWHTDKRGMPLGQYIDGGIGADIEVNLLHLRMHLEAMLSATQRQG